MGASDAAAVARAYLDAVNAGDIEAVVALTAPGFIHHSGAGDLDSAGQRAGFAYYKAAFPDLHYDLEELLLVDGGNAVVARWTMRGTHRGEFFGVAGTGRTFESPGVSLHRIADGLIVEEWEYNADVGQMRQLGFRLEPPEGDSEGA
jgi:steroid delta-isomerase-like uncharacterized protein